MALEQALKTFGFMQGYGEGLVAELSADKAFTLICDGGVNPAWIIGHLATVGNIGMTMAGGESKVDLEAWKALYGGGSTASTDPAGQPSWDELLGAWRQVHGDLMAAVPGLGADVLGQPNPIDRIKESLPTLHDLFGFLLTAHVGMHLGQLSTWRRVQGLPPLF